MSTTQPQLQHAGRGDRVARTREAICFGLALRWPAKWRRSCATSPRWPASRRAPFPAFCRYRRALCRRARRVLARAGGEADPDVAWPLDERIATDDQPVRRALRAAAADVDLRRDAAAPLHRSGRAWSCRCIPPTAAACQWFDRELTALPAEARERTLNALAMALAPESWVVLRERLGLTVEQARDELALHVFRRPCFTGSATQRTPELFAATES